MRISLYLHKDIINTLRYYGDISDVINKILELCENDVVDLFDKPAAPPRGDASRIEVNITNSYYLSLMEEFPKNSSKISLRRLLYWFVENDMFEETGVTLPETIQQDQTVLNKIIIAEDALQSVMSKLDLTNRDNCTKALKILEEVRLSL